MGNLRYFFLQLSTSLSAGFVGEQSCKLPEMLKKTSDYFEEDARNRIKLISKLLPVVFFIPIAIFVACVIISTAGKIMTGLPGL